MKKILKILHFPNWLVITLAIVLVLRIPSFFEPFSYGDEMIYLTLGEGVRQGEVLYRDLHDNKPPLLYIIAAIAGSVFWFKVILAFWNLITIVLFWKLGKVLFPRKKKLTKIATVTFALLTTLPLLEGNIANSELFLIGTTIAAFLILFSRKLTPKNLFFAGILFALSTLFKVPAIFDIPAIFLFWLITGGLKVKNIKKVARNALYLSIGFLSLIGLTFIWYYLRGGFQEYLIAGFLQNVGYLSSFRPDEVAEPFLVKNMPLLIRGGLTFLGVVILYFYRKRLSKQFIFLTLWLLLTLFAVTLSERPYPHYLIQSLPPLSFMVAMLVALENIEQSLVIIPLAVTLFVPVYFRFWFYQTAEYYSRFVKLATRTISKEEYLASFGGHVPRSYEIADIINKSSDRRDKIFVWGSNNSTVYALSRRLPPIRYVAQYHINDFSSNGEVLEKLKTSLPKIIVVLPNSPSFPELILLLRNNYILMETIDDAEVWTLISPEVRAIIAP